jgi:hypothetical protein
MSSGLKTFLILGPTGEWQCERRYAAASSSSSSSSSSSTSPPSAAASPADPAGARGGDVAKLAGFVSNLVQYRAGGAYSNGGASTGSGGAGRHADTAAVKAAAAESGYLSVHLGRQSLATVLPLGRHALVLVSDPQRTGAALPLRRLREVANLLVLLFGDPDGWDNPHDRESPRLATDGVEDLIDGVLESRDPTLVLGGVRRVSLPSTTRDALDQVLRATPNATPGVGAATSSKTASSSSGSKSGSGSGGEASSKNNPKRTQPTSSPYAAAAAASAAAAEKRRKEIANIVPKVALLTHGCRSVLHSTIPLDHLRRLVVLLQLRPLGPIESTMTPVYHAPAGKRGKSRRRSGENKEASALAGGQKDPRRWFQLIVRQAQRGVLVAEFPINTPPQHSENLLHDLQRRLHVSCNAIVPAEEPPVPMHLFVDHDTVAFAVFDRKNGTSVVPQMRPGPPGEAERLWGLFWWFLASAMDSWQRQPTLRRVVLVEGDISFHATRHEELGGGSTDVFLMSSSSVPDGNVALLTHELIAQTAKM